MRYKDRTRDECWVLLVLVEARIQKANFAFEMKVLPSFLSFVPTSLKSFSEFSCQVSTGNMGNE